MRGQGEAAGAQGNDLDRAHTLDRALDHALARAHTLGHARVRALDHALDHTPVLAQPNLRDDFGAVPPHPPRATLPVTPGALRRTTTLVGTRAHGGDGGVRLVAAQAQALALAQSMIRITRKAR